MTRTFIVPVRAQYQHTQVENGVKKWGNPSRLTRTLALIFGSSSVAGMSVLTIVPADFKEKFFVRFSTVCDTHISACHKQARIPVGNGEMAYRLNLHSITSKTAAV